MKLEVDLADDTITVDGITISFLMLKQLADPDPNIFFRTYIEGDRVKWEQFERKDVEELIKA